MNLPSWNLTDLFKGIDDPAIDALLDGVSRRAQDFRDRYCGKVATLRSKDLRGAIRAYEAILQDAAKPETYAHLVFAADSKTPAHGAFLQRMKTRSVEISQQLLFFELELASMDETALRRHLRNPQLKPYRHYLQLQLAWKPHRLSEPEEKILNDKALTGRSAFVRLFDEELSQKEFRFSFGGKTSVKSEAQMLDLLHSSKRNERKAAAATFTRGLREELRRLTFVTNTLLQDKRTDDRYRKFSSPEEARHLDNETTQAAVDALTKAVVKRYGTVRDFYRFKRLVMGVDRLYDYDRYAPVASSAAHVPYEDAKRIVLTAYRSFSPKMANVAKGFFDNGWIDAAPKLGKRGGAFCMFVTPDLHPYVFVNYGGRVNDVMTLAHELGHAVHASLARKQSFLNFYMPLTVAETASVFGEMLVFDHLRRTIPDDRERFALVVHKIESIFATVFRQIAMYAFEGDLHAASAERGELSSDDISKLWRKRQTELFGGSVTLTSDYDVWWSYISHFIHSPFYVYAYAFGELLTLALFARYRRRGKRMAKAYEELLAAGGSKTPVELVRALGIDIADPSFWDEGLSLVDDLVAEAKALHRSMKKR